MAQLTGDGPLGLRRTTAKRKGKKCKYQGLTRMALNDFSLDAALKVAGSAGVGAATSVWGQSQDAYNGLGGLFGGQ
jgi:hypothetical protein